MGVALVAQGHTSCWHAPHLCLLAEVLQGLIRVRHHGVTSRLPVSRADLCEVMERAFDNYIERMDDGQVSMTEQGRPV